ncbi:MAG: ribonuclease D [Pseudomonadales bacterium]
MVTLADYDAQALERSASAPVMVATNEMLRQCCEHWMTLPLISVDTEFQRVDTFYPIAGLLQIADEQRCYLIDPLAIDDFAPLAALFSCESVVKVLHAASEDLEVFSRLLGVLPRPMYDTQVAAAFIGWGFSMGLQRMLDTVLDVQIGKAETNSNWLQRPLSKKQEHYAALDVAYLAEIYRRQRAQLESLGRLAWFEEDSLRVIEHYVATDYDDGLYYLRFSQMSHLSGKKLWALKTLTNWRERESRERDVPRNKVLRNQSLLSIINRWPSSTGQLSACEEVRGKTLRQDGEVILSVLKSAPQQCELEPGILAIEKPLDPVWNKRLKKLKQIARQCAERLEMAPEILLRKKDLEALVRNFESGTEPLLPEGLQGWREALFGEQLLAQLALYRSA